MMMTVDASVQRSASALDALRAREGKLSLQFLMMWGHPEQVYSRPQTTNLCKLHSADQRHLSMLSIIHLHPVLSVSVRPLSHDSTLLTKVGIGGFCCDTAAIGTHQAEPCSKRWLAGDNSRASFERLACIEQIYNRT